MDDLTGNLDAPIYSLRDFLNLAAAARAGRHPLDVVVDLLLDLASTDGP